MEKGKEKMTIHRALSELKLIDKKITKQISEIDPVGSNQKGKLVGGHMTEEDFKSTVESKYTSIDDLIKRKSTIKAAIVSSNATTKVTVGKEAMSVADAITNKDTIKLRKTFIDQLKARHNHAVAIVNKNNDVVRINADRILEAALGKEHAKASEDQINSIRKPYIEGNEWHLIDPIGVAKKIQELEGKLFDFESEVDAVLSESNAITTISI